MDFREILWEYSPNFICIPILSNTLVPFKTTNLIVSISGVSALLVDPGANKGGEPELLHILANLYMKHGVTDLQIFITHHHHDHWEGLAVVAENSSIFQQVFVVAHPNTLKHINTSLPKKEIQGDDVITVGELLIDVVYTPGHTDGSLSLFHKPTRTLVPGDHIVGVGSAVLDPHHGSMQQYFKTTKHMIEINPRVALPAHGPPNYTPVNLLNTYLKHRQYREDKILEAYQNGYTTLEAILQVVYGDVPNILWPAALSNISLHLVKLCDDGKLCDLPASSL